MWNLPCLVTICDIPLHPPTFYLSRPSLCSHSPFLPFSYSIYVSSSFIASAQLLFLCAFYFWPQLTSSLSSIHPSHWPLLLLFSGPCWPMPEARISFCVFLYFLLSQLICFLCFLKASLLHCFVYYLLNNLPNVKFCIPFSCYKI